MINKYIKPLLVDNKRVIIPDFGGFVVKRSLTGDTISFNNFLKFNDDLLANFIVAEDGVEYSQAHLKIKQMVRDIEISLDKSGEYKIEEVGVLIKDKKGNIRFVKAIGEEVLPASPILNTEIADEQLVEMPVQVQENTEDAESSLPNVEVDDTPVEEKKKRTLLIVLLLLLLMLGVWAVYYYSHANNETSTTLVIEEGADDKVNSDGWLSEKRDEMIDKRANELVDAVVAPKEKGLFARIIDFFKNLFRKKETIVKDVAHPSEVLSVAPVMPPNQVDTIHGILVIADKFISPKGEERYYVIVGAFADEENAIALNDELIADEYASEVFDRYNGFNAVSIGGYPSLDIALRVCGENLSQTPNVWILVK